jgi:hypothetical protein
MARKLEVQIIGDSASLERALGRSAQNTGKFGSSLDGLARSAKIAGVALAAGLGIAAKIGFAEMVEGERVSAQTGAALESTGHSAKTTAKEIEALAMSLSKMSGVDDEAIQSGQNMLLTFTKVRNEVGAGNDIFNQATKATLDLSVALGKDMPAAALMVGKALNDPIAGLTALGRAGVQFTEQQKNQIKAMVEAGDAMGAQKMILAELTTQMGGSAEALGTTLAGKVNIAKNAFAEMAASIVVALMPALLQAASVVSRLSAYFQEHETAAKVAAASVVALTVAVWALNFALAANPVVLTIVGLAAFTAALVIAWQTSEVARKVIIGLGLVFMALPTAIALAWHESETFRNVVRAAFAAVQAAGMFLKNSVDEVVAVFRALQSAGSAVAGFLSGPLSAALDVARSRVAVLGAAVGAARAALETLRTIAGAVAGFLDGPLRSAFGVAGSAAHGLAGALGAIVGALSSIISFAGRAADAIRSIPSVGGIIGRIPGLASGTGNFSGGLAIVGERGPELVNLPAGSSVTPNVGVRGGGGGGDVHVHVGTIIGGDLRQAAKELADPIRRALIQDSHMRESIFGGRA